MAECMNHQGNPKVRYLTQTEAKRSIKKQHIKGVHTYSCSECGHWHIGRAIPPKLVALPVGRVVYVSQSDYGPNRNTSNKKGRAIQNAMRHTKRSQP